MPPQPTKLAFNATTLVIDWSDGRQTRCPLTELRANCPCAGCMAARSESPMRYDQSATGASNLTIRQMTPVGNYAYKIAFSDGHDTGIYTLEQLYRLGRYASQR